MDRPTILKKILQVKAEEVAERSRKLPLPELRARAVDAGKTRGFKKTLTTRVQAGKAGIIAEIKKASPSKGIIRADFNPAWLAQSYEQGGATCLSVLTDISFFQGGDSYLQQARNACHLPVLRKDFIISPWQVYESRVLNSDCILLIAAALDKNQLEDLYHLAIEIGLDVLLEVHNEEELESVLPLQESILGINNRNLHTFETTLETTYQLLPLIKNDRIIVTESGITKKEDISSMFENNVRAFLIGETFMRAENPGGQLAELFYGKI